MAAQSQRPPHAPPLCPCVRPQAGAFKIGDAAGTLDNIIACKLYRPGSVGFVSKSGGMSNEMYNTLARATDGLYEGGFQPIIRGRGVWGQCSTQFESNLPYLRLVLAWPAGLY